MKKFNKVFDQIMKQNGFCLKYVDKILFEKAEQPKCLYKSVKFFDRSLIFEMNDNVYPIPKDVLSFYVGASYEDNFDYVAEYKMSKIVHLTLSSENLDKVKFSIDRLKSVANQNILFVCLHADKEEAWQKNLQKWFKDNEINDILKSMKNKPGASGTYHSGFLIIVNSDFINDLKDAEEVIEHEFIHLFEEIDGANPADVSLNLLELLQNPYEYKTYVVTLMNRLDKMYDRWCTENFEEDLKENRHEFLDRLFTTAADAPSVNDLINEYESLDSSTLMKSNMQFFWSMCHWKTKEFDDFKKKIYEHFNF